MCAYAEAGATHRTGRYRAHGSRGHNRRDCFLEQTDYLGYLANLRDLTRKTGCALHAYCLMQRYVQYFNRRYRRTGTLWEGRYKSCLVLSAQYVLACYRYIERNPVRAGMVASVPEYPWSSHGGNSGRASNALLTPHVEFDSRCDRGRVRIGR